MRTKSLLTLAISVLIACQSFSQTSNKDSCTCVPNSKLRIAAYKIDRGEKDSVKVLLLGEKIDSLSSINTTLEKRIAGKDSTIRLYSFLEVNFNKLETNYLKDINLCDQKYQAERKISDGLLKQLKGARRKTIFVGLAGIAASALAFYLGAK